MVPIRPKDRFSATKWLVEESRDMAQSYGFMMRRDRLLEACEALRGKLKVQRIRLYEYVESSSCGPVFRGLVEIGGIYANFLRLQLPLAADWYSQNTYDEGASFRPLMYPPPRMDPPPPRYQPTAFWRGEPPERWADILLQNRKGETVGKLSVDNSFDREKPLPVDAAHCRLELESLVSHLGPVKRERANPERALEAHRRWMLLHVLTEILAAMIVECDLDRARVYEYNSSESVFEARAELGGTSSAFATFERPYSLSSGREDPISFVTRKKREARTYRRGETVALGKGDAIKILFKCDEIVGSGGLDYLMDIPLIVSRELVGKITADNKLKEPVAPGPNPGRLDRLLTEGRYKIDHFATLAADAIAKSRTLAERMKWWRGFSEVRRRVPGEVWIALISGVVAGGSVALVRWLLGS